MCSTLIRCTVHCVHKIIIKLLHTVLAEQSVYYSVEDKSLFTIATGFSDLSRSSLVDRSVSAPNCR